MALSNSESKRYQFVKLNGKADKDTTPLFWLSEKIGDKWQKTSSFDTISGSLSKAVIKDYVYEEVNKKLFHIELNDGDETISVDLNHCQCTYSILNSLINVSSGQFVKIKVYKKTDKETGNVFPGAFITDTKGDMIKWGVDIKSIPKPIPVLVGDKPFIKDGRPVKDDTPVREFWEKQFMDHIATKGATNADPYSDVPSAAAPDMPSVELPDDLPF